MGMYKYIRELWNNPQDAVENIWKERLIEWRKEQVTIRIDRPTRLDRARSLGYKAKPGLILVRQRVDRGGRQRPQIRAGRRSKHSGRRKDVDKNYQGIAEERAQKKFVNCEVLNSYYVGQDGEHYWYEIILVDRAHPQIIADKQLNWICNKRGRAARGLTSAGRKSRGLRHKGKGAEKFRPSRTANLKRRNN